MKEFKSRTKKRTTFILRSHFKNSWRSLLSFSFVCLTFIRDRLVLSQWHFQHSFPPAFVSIDHLQCDTQMTLISATRFNSIQSIFKEYCETDFFFLYPVHPFSLVSLSLQHQFRFSSVIWPVLNDEDVSWQFIILKCREFSLANGFKSNAMNAIQHYENNDSSATAAFKTY